MRPDGSPWWDEIPGGLKGAPNPTRHPEFQDWRRWGASQNLVVTYVDDSTQELPLLQVVEARYDRPTAWILGFNAVQNTSDGLVDNSIVVFHVQYGIGAGRFLQDFPVPLLPANPGPTVVPFGPIPAETIIVSATLFTSANLASVLPKKTGFSIGAFMAPQVWY